MANQSHLDIFLQGEEAWNAWRRRNWTVSPDLCSADLARVDLRRRSLDGVWMDGANLVQADFSSSDTRDLHLSGANLQEATFEDARFVECNFSNANFARADLSGATLDTVDLQNANFDCANIMGTNFYGSNLKGANFSEAIAEKTFFVGVDLSQARDLAYVRHVGPSFVGLDTIYSSQGRIPRMFLHGCGVPMDLVDNISALLVNLEPIQFHSCFVSFSHHDEKFALRLHAKMQSEGLRVWFAPHAMKGGEKLFEQVVSAIQVHDKLLLVLSDQSMSSAWVATEIRRALRVEREQNRRKLFPIRLVDFERIQQWECFDADSGKDLAVELREYFIPDFSNWKDHDAFEAAFARLLKDLKAQTNETSTQNAEIK